MSRSQTNSAHGPTNDANGATSAGPAPVAIHAQKSATWTTTTTSSTRARRMSGASGSFGVTRYQWPRIIAAKTPPIAALTTASWMRERYAPSGASPHARAPNRSAATAAARAGPSAGGRARTGRPAPPDDEPGATRT